MLRTEEFTINMGPQHPSTHGVLRLVLKLDGEYVVEAEPVIGYLHRSLEKMAEGRHYGQYIPVTDRLDYVTSMSANYVYVLAVERLADIVPTPRAEVIRVMMVELNRLASHLLWFGTMALDLGATTPFLYAFVEREKILDMFEATCGQRLTYNYLRLGGVAYDLPSEVRGTWLDGAVSFEKACEKFCNELPGGHRHVRGTAERERHLPQAHQGRGRAVEGDGHPVRLLRPRPARLRSAVRRAAGSAVLHLPRARVQHPRPAQRRRVGPLQAPPPRDPRERQDRPAVPGTPAQGQGQDRAAQPHLDPPGEVYSRIETARGDMGTFLVSNGTEKAHRCKFRTPSFSHVCVLPHLLKGALVADLIAIGGSLDLVLPEVDR